MDGTTFSHKKSDLYKFGDAFVVTQSQPIFKLSDREPESPFQGIKGKSEQKYQTIPIKGGSCFAVQSSVEVSQSCDSLSCAPPILTSSTEFHVNRECTKTALEVGVAAAMVHPTVRAAVATTVFVHELAK